MSSLDLHARLAQARAPVPHQLKRLLTFSAVAQWAGLILRLRQNQWKNAQMQTRRLGSGWVPLSCELVMAGGMPYSLPTLISTLRRLVGSVGRVTAWTVCLPSYSTLTT